MDPTIASRSVSDRHRYCSSLRGIGTETPSERRLLGYCLLAAVIGVPASVVRFPNDGITLLVIPVVILSIAMFADGYSSHWKSVHTRSQDGRAVRSERGSERARFVTNEVSENRGKASGERQRPVSERSE